MQPFTIVGGGRIGLALSDMSGGKDVSVLMERDVRGRAGHIQHRMAPLVVHATNLVTDLSSTCGGVHSG
jgi:hypothetical protein